MKIDHHKDLKNELFLLERRLEELNGERNQIIQRIAFIKGKLKTASSYQTIQPAPQYEILSNQQSSQTPKDKISLFMNLFRGRSDVYPKRWSNTKKNTKGYSPACFNEWERGICKFCQENGMLSFNRDYG